jgi:hypothetical protein
LWSANLGVASIQAKAFMSVTTFNPLPFFVIVLSTFLQNTRQIMSNLIVQCAFRVLGAVIETVEVKYLFGVIQAKIMYL